jgi:hypothetical protein
MTEAELIAALQQELEDDGMLMHPAQQQQQGYSQMVDPGAFAAAAAGAAAGFGSAFGATGFTGMNPVGVQNSVECSAVGEVLLPPRPPLVMPPPCQSFDNTTVPACDGGVFASAAAAAAAGGGYGAVNAGNNSGLVGNAAAASATANATFNGCYSSAKLRMEWDYNASMNNSSNCARQQQGTSAEPDIINQQQASVAPLGAGVVNPAASVSAFQAADSAAYAFEPKQQQQMPQTITGSEPVRRQSGGSSSRLQWLVQQVQHELQLSSSQDLQTLDGRELRTLVCAALAPGAEQGSEAAVDLEAAAAAAAAMAPSKEPADEVLNQEEAAAAAAAAAAEAESAAAAAEAESAAAAAAAASTAATAVPHPIALPPAAPAGSWGSGSFTGRSSYDQWSTFDQFDQASGAVRVNSNSSCNSSSSNMSWAQGFAPMAVGAADGALGWGVPVPIQGQQQQQVMLLQPSQLIPKQQQQLQLGRQVSAPATLLNAYRELQQLQAIKNEAATTGGVRCGSAWHPSAGK